jgi:hypothetical protein
MTLQRRAAATALILAAVLSVAGCTPVEANAWRLGKDGTIGFVDCTEFRASRIELTYLSSGIPVAEVVMEGEERAFGGGRELSRVPGQWLVSTSVVALAEWDSFRVTVSAAPFPLGTSHLSNRRTDPAALDQVFEAEIERSELRLGEWVWDETGSDCEILPESDGEPVYTGALSAAAYEQLLTEHPDLDSLADALADLGRIAPILAFQALLLEEIGAGALPGEDPSLTLARIRPAAAPSALLAAELAATRLGFIWDPDAVRAGETD